MTGERIDIELTDKVAPGIRDKILGIATASRQADTALEKLKAQLASINDTALAKLTAATSSLTSEITKQVSAQQKLSAETQRITDADAKAALTQQKLATEIAKTEAANARAQTAATRAATATLQQEAASARLTVAKQREKAAVERANAAAAAKAASGLGRADDIAAYGAALDRLRAKYNPLYAAIAQYKAAVEGIRNAHKVGAISADEMTAAIQRERQAALGTIGALKGRQGATLATTGAVRLQGRQLAQLGYQLNDVFVSLASGQAPLMVLIQQGSQIGQLFGPGTGLIGILKGVASGFAALVVPFLPVLAIAAGVTAVFAGLTYEINKTTKTSVTMGDTFKAVFQVAYGAIKDLLLPGIKAISPAFSTVYNTVVSITKTTWNIIIGIAVGTVNSIIKAFGLLPAALKDLLIMAANGILTVVESLVNGIIAKINTLTELANSASIKLGQGAIFDPVANVDLSKYKMQVSGAAKEVASTFSDEFSKSMNTDYVGKAFNAIRDQAVKNANARIAESKEGKAAAKAAEDRATSLAKVNRELDTELARMKDLKPQRELEQQYDQIANDLASKKITLTQEESAAIRDKLQAIQNFKDAQQQLDRIYDEATGPAREYNAVLEAANRLYQEGVINSRQYFQQVSNAKAKLLETSDSIADGFQLGFIKINSSMDTVANTISDTMVTSFNSLSDAINEAARTGKLDFKSLTQSILADIQKMIVQLTIIRPLMNIVGGFLSSSFGIPTYDSLGATSGSTSATVALGASTLPGFATGGSFEIGGKSGVDQNIVAFRGTKGEHVNVTKGDPTQAKVEVNVINNTNANVRVQEKQNTTGGKSIEVIIDEVTAKNIRRYGSASNQAMRDTFGINTALTGGG